MFATSRRVYLLASSQSQCMHPHFICISYDDLTHARVKEFMRRLFTKWDILVQSSVILKWCLSFMTLWAAVLCNTNWWTVLDTSVVFYWRVSWCGVRTLMRGHLSRKRPGRFDILIYISQPAKMTQLISSLSPSQLAYTQLMSCRIIFETVFVSNVSLQIPKRQLMPPESRLMNHSCMAQQKGTRMGSLSRSPFPITLIIYTLCLSWTQHLKHCSCCVPS